MAQQYDDSNYLEEVTYCLTQSIVRLLEIRPQDPIEFLALSLKNHRRLQPRSVHGESNNIPADDKENTVAIGIEESLVKSTDNSAVNLCVAASAPPTSQRNLNVTASVRLRADDGDSDDGIEDSTFIVKDKFVHRQCFDIFTAIGDICDDDDFG